MRSAFATDQVRLLLDTHAVLWWLADDPRLSTPAREAIGSAERPMFSAGTLFEISIKASIGKLEIADGWIEELFSEGFGLLGILPAHAEALRKLPHVEVGGRPLRDPFDRLLIAQAQVEDLPIVTRDPSIPAYGAATIW
jgi:PIN domain nuclease of toxin-antitoxin system